MGNIHSSGPNEALVVSGGCCGQTHNKQIIVGSWAWAWWCVTDVQRLSLEVMTLEPRCECETKEGVPIAVTGCAQVKIMKSIELLTSASEQFLGKDMTEVHNTLLQTMEGHLRSILGTLTVEEVYTDRELFAKEVVIIF